MPNPLKRSYPLNALKVKDLVVAEAMTQEELADKAGISRTTLSKSMNGHFASMETIRRIANALNIEDVQSLIGAGTKVEPNNSHDDVEVFIGRPDDEEAILASVRRAARERKRLLMYLSPGIIAMLCCLGGLAPIDARPLFIAGMVFAVLGTALAFQKKILIPLPMKLLLAMPLAAFVLNVTAYVAWPRAIGIFPVKGGYTFGFGKRQPGWLATKPSKRFYHVVTSPQILPGEVIEISPDPRANQWNSVRITNPVVNLICYVELEAGQNVVAMRRRGIEKHVNVHINNNGLLLYEDPMLKAYQNPPDNIPTNVGEIPFLFTEIHDLNKIYPSGLPFPGPDADGKVQVFVRFFRGDQSALPPNLAFFVDNTPVSFDIGSGSFRTPQHSLHSFRVESNGKEFVKTIIFPAF